MEMRHCREAFSHQFFRDYKKPEDFILAAVLLISRNRLKRPICLERTKVNRGTAGSFSK